MNVLDNKILDEIRKIVKEKDSSAKIYLYGSRSKGTATNESDWDLLILLDKKHISLEDEQNITYPLYDLEFDTGEIISPIIYSSEEWNLKHKVTPFYKNVMDEGILL